MCRWELLVGLSELPRSGRTHRESPCPRTKQEGVKMAPKSLERRFRVWSGQPALVNRERHKLSSTTTLAGCPCLAEPALLSWNYRTFRFLLPRYLFIPSSESTVAHGGACKQITTGMVINPPAASGPPRG